jgi:hypothetical protein
MLVIWLGAVLVFSGVLFMAVQAVWRGPLSDAKRSRSAGVTLEPRTPGAGGVFGFKANWPGFVLIALGAFLLLAGAAF